MKFKNKFNRMSTLATIILGASALTSCSSALTKKDCEETNYYEMGLADGKAGKSSENLQKTTKECNKLGIEAAAPQYGYGRQAGLAKYCSEDNARDDAKSGKSDSICWRESFPEYQVAYREALESRQKDKEDDLKDVQASQAKSKKENAKISSELQQIERQQAAH